MSRALSVSYIDKSRLLRVGSSVSKHGAGHPQNETGEQCCDTTLEQRHQPGPDGHEKLHRCALYIGNWLIVNESHASLSLVLPDFEPGLSMELERVTRTNSRPAITGCLAANAAHSRRPHHARSAIVCAWVGHRRSHASVAANRSIWTALLRRLPRRRKGTAGRPQIQSNSASAAATGARERAAYLPKRDLRGRLPLKPAPRTTWCSAHKRTRSTCRLLEHATEVAHRVHPIRSIHTQPVQDGSQVFRDCPTRGIDGAAK